MPIYEYACQDCGHAFDELQKMGAEPLVDCPECGKPALKKLLSAPNFRLKGGGWYETDFKDKNQRNLAGDQKKAVDAKGNGADKDPKKADSAADGKADKKAGKTDASPAKTEPAKKSGTKSGGTKSAASD